MGAILLNKRNCVLFLRTLYQMETITEYGRLEIAKDEYLTVYSGFLVIPCCLYGKFKLFDF
jgi:hypothetical protein